MNKKNKKKNKLKRRIILQSSQGTGVFYKYLRPKNSKSIVKIKKYDYKIRKHVDFIESKIKKSK